MGIRNRLLILLLTVALVPLLATFALRQVSMRVVRKRLASRASEVLDASARQSLDQLVRGHVEIFASERQLVDSLLRRQVREIETALARPGAGPVAREEFGFDPDLEQISVAPDGSLDVRHSMHEPPAPVDHRRQYMSLAPGADPLAVADDLCKLHTITATYHEIFRMAPEGILWLYTSLDSGLHTAYPGGDIGANLHGYDPRQRPWYQKAKAAGTIVRDGPAIDAATGLAIVTISAPIHYPNGSFAGVTAMDRTVRAILDNIEVPERWAQGAEKMLVRPAPGTDRSGKVLSVLMHERSMDANAPSHEALPRQWLVSSDSGSFKTLVGDIETGRPGVRRMEHNGQPALWAYRSLDAGQAAILLIIPYERVTALARTTEQLLLQESRFWLKATGLVLLGVTGAAVVLAARRARIFTEPIRELTAASLKLARGDHDAQVHIATRDELEQLGRIFNETGPKLKERQKIKQSLELARAIQQGLLPRTAPSVAGLDMAGLCAYCDETGGDYYDFIDLPTPPRGAVGIALGDVTGHGIGAALLMASIRSALRAEARHYGPDLVGLFDELNRQIARDTDDDKFVTLFYGLLHAATRSLTWASAGHDPALLYRARDGRIEELENTGMPIGLLENVPFERAGPVCLQQGDVLVIGTDGIWEATNADGLAFGKDRLLDIIRRGAPGAAEELCESVVRHVTQFADPAPRTDDITLVVVKAV